MNEDYEEADVSSLSTLVDDTLDDSDLYDIDFEDDLDKQFYDACFSGNHELSAELLDQGATNDYQFFLGWSALHWACIKGKVCIFPT